MKTYDDELISDMTKTYSQALAIGLTPDLQEKLGFVIGATAKNSTFSQQKAIS